METLIDIDHELKIIRARASGRMDRVSGRQYISECRRKAGEFGYHILHDIRKLDLRAGVGDMYEVVKSLPELQHADKGKTKVALLVSEDTPGVQKYLFYETASRNEGFNVSVLLDLEKAVEWLK